MHTRSLHAVLLSALLLTGMAVATPVSAQNLSEMPAVPGAAAMAPPPAISSGVLTGSRPINLRPGAFIAAPAYDAQREAEQARAAGAAANAPYTAYLQSQNKTSVAAYNAQLARARAATQNNGQPVSRIPSPFPAGYGQ